MKVETIAARVGLRIHPLPMDEDGERYFHLIDTRMGRPLLGTGGRPHEFDLQEAWDEIRLRHKYG